MNKDRTTRKHLQIGRLRRMAAIFLMLVAASGVVYAAYVQRDTLKKYFAGAEKEFYFCSDLLSCEVEVPIYNLRSDLEDPNASLCSFYLQNFCDDLSYSASPVTYDILVRVHGLGEKHYASGSLNGGETKDELYEISFSDLVALGYSQSDLTALDLLRVCITATSSSPYHKTLKGEFWIYPLEAALAYRMLDNAGDVIARFRIVVEEGDQLSKSVVISWPQGAAPDMTNPLFVDAEPQELQSRSRTVLLNTAATYEIVFFKENPADNYTDATDAKAVVQ